MKICYINPTFLIRRPIAELVGQLADSNEVGIIVPKKPFSDEDKVWHSNEALKKAKVYQFSAVNLPFGNFEWPIPITPMFFIQLLRAFWRYDVVHIWTYFYIHIRCALMLSLFFRRTKLIMSCDTFPAYSFKSGWLVDTIFRVHTTLTGWCTFRIPDRIHLYGRSLVPIARKIGLPADKIAVIPTGIDPGRFKKGKDIRKGLGLKKEDIVLVYAGLIVPRKGIDVMLKTLSAIDDKKVKLLLVGEGPGKREFKALTQSLGLNQRVKFTGWRKDLPDIFKSSDILLLPSRGEGLSGIIFEAMASGMPVIASKIPCIPDQVEDGKTGILCRQDDVEAFANAANMLVKDGKKRKLMGRRGREKIKAFAWNRIINKYTEMYQCVE